MTKVIANVDRSRAGGCEYLFLFARLGCLLPQYWPRERFLRLIIPQLTLPIHCGAIAVESWMSGQISNAALSSTNSSPYFPKMVTIASPDSLTVVPELVRSVT